MKVNEQRTRTLLLSISLLCQQGRARRLGRYVGDEQRAFPQRANQCVDAKEAQIGVFP
jgi:hypothetical protein